MLRVYKNVTDGHMNTGFVKVSSRSLLELDDKLMQSVTRGSDRKEWNNQNVFPQHPNSQET